MKMIMLPKIWVIRQDCDETRHVWRIDWSQPFQRRNSHIQACPRHHTGHYETQRIDQQMLLVSGHLLVAIVSALGDLSPLWSWPLGYQCGRRWELARCPAFMR